LRVTIKASSCGYRVPTLSSSEKLKAGRTSILPLLGSRVKFFANDRAIDITLNGWKPVLPRAARISLIVPKGDLEEASL